MAHPRLVSARWLKNHGVSLRYAGNGGFRYVPPDGVLTVGEVAKLLNTYKLKVYRLEEQGRIRFVDRRGGGIAMVRLAHVRKYQAQS